MFRSLVISSIFLLAALSAPAQPGPQPPFSLQLEAATTQPLPGLHSFAFAQSGARWLFVGGRTNGLHGFSTNDNFPPEFANGNIIVIDTTTWQVYQSPVSVLGIPLADPLRSTNMQYIQQGDYLYMVGGFGWDSTANAFRTFPTLTALHTDSLIDAVIAGQPIAPHIRQYVDTNFRVSGGELAKLGNSYYLIFGHNFSGRYSDPPIPTFTQRYTNQIRTFQIQDDGVNIQINNYAAFTDTNNFHRRDLNVGPIVKPDGSFALMAYSGVFQKTVNWPWPSPVLIDATGGTLQSGFTQLLNNYTCGTVPLFDSLQGDMYTVFLGGMGWNTYDTQNNAWLFDSLVPFVSDIGVVTHYGSGTWAQSVLPVRMPSLQGSNAKFIPVPVPSYANDVIKLRDLQGRILVGYLYGGIRSVLPNLSPVTVAEDTLYRVYITPDQLLLHQAAFQNEISALQIFPNPSNDQVCLRIKTTTETPVLIEFFDLQGNKVQQVNNQLAQGQHDVWMNTQTLSSGTYLVKITTTTGVCTNRFSIVH